MEDHSSTAAVIGRQYSVSKSQCMMSCARNRSCNTFDFPSIDGLCDLLETSDMCMSHTVTNGTTLVRIYGCEATPIPPWMVMVPTQRKLQRMEPSAVGSQRVILRTPDGTRKVARVLLEGVYLSGYILGSTRNFQGKKNGSNIIWPKAIQFLTYAQPSDYLWINFTRGDEVPASAVVGGYSRDQTPLYVISAMLTSWKSGYYNIDT